MTTALGTSEQAALRTVDPTTSREWASLVATASSSVFHSPQWMAVLQQTYGLEFRACLLELRGRTAAGMPWCEVNDLLGPRRVTLAFSDYCDPLYDRPEDVRVLAEAAASARVPWTLRAMARNVSHVPYSAASATSFKWQGIDLAGEGQALWDRLTPMARRGVQKAEREGLTVRHATDKRELREWFLLHLQLRKTKHHLLAQPYAFFEHIWDSFIAQNQGFLALAVHGDRIVAGTLYLLWKDVCYYKFNASSAEALTVRPNNLLLWRGIVEAKERGCRLLDLGRSNARQEGLLNFKRGFGAREEDLSSVTYRFDVPESPQQRQAHDLFQQLTRLFVQDAIPEGVSEEAGNLLYRFFT